MWGRAQEILLCRRADGGVWVSARALVQVAVRAARGHPAVAWARARVEGRGEVTQVWLTVRPAPGVSTGALVEDLGRLVHGQVERWSGVRSTVHIALRDR